MLEPPETMDRQVPLRALAISILALLVPVIGALAFPESLGEYGAILWLSALVPAFLLAYYRGWKGVTTALAVGMATLSVTQVVASWIGRDIPDILLGIVVAYLGIALGIGWVADALHRERETVEDLAFTDILTHLPNRRHARIFLDNEFAASERGRMLAVVLFDLDFFKEYNDRYGHPAGDAALQAFAAILQNTTRKMNLSARFGGEEFLAVLAGSDAEGAMIFAERVREGLQGTNLKHGALTVSAGVASHHPTMRSPDELLAAADHALYRAKHEGRNCVRVFGRPVLEGVAEDAPILDESGGVVPGLTGEADDDGPASDYPRPEEEIGRSRPPVTLLPHQITGFGADKRTLLVENEDQVRALLSSYLGQEGFIVDTAPDFPTAIQLLESEYDVVLTDVRLPGPSGTQLIRAVRARWPLTPVLVMTGLRDPSVAAEAMAAGADHYITKPFGMPELRAHLVDLLARRARRIREREVSREEVPAGSPQADLVQAGLEELVRAAEHREEHASGRGARLAAIGAELARNLAPTPDPDNPGAQLAPLIDPAMFSRACAVMGVGRISVPVDILNRPGPLDAAELAIVRGSVLNGSRLLQSIGVPEEAIAAVRWQGERFDGTGVPNGLSGATIPLSARLAAIARALEAMTRDRPFASARTWDDSVQHVRSLFGTHFDPELQPAFEAALPRLKMICADRD
jgi:diguanylate cyclase (GGDEF)-like protein